MSNKFSKKEIDLFQSIVDEKNKSMHFYRKENGRPALCGYMVNTGTLFVYPFGAVFGLKCQGCNRLLDITFDGVIATKEDL